MNSAPIHPPTPQNVKKFIDAFSRNRAPVPTKYVSGHLINGTLDHINIAPMGGVLTYPYKVNERLYHEDFAGIVASRITHPFLTTACHEGSLPFNILSNSAYDEGVIAGGNGARWRTEQASQFYAKKQNTGSGAGARTEQEIR